MTKEDILEQIKLKRATIDLLDSKSIEIEQEIGRLAKTIRQLEELYKMRS